MKRLMLAVAALLCVVMSASAQTVDIKEGDKVPGFKVKTSEGKTLDINSLRGKVVLINFWATWCPYCIHELDVVQEKIINRFKGKDFIFLPISRGEEPAVVDAFMKKKGYKFMTGYDTATEIFLLFAEKGIPRNYLIDKKGNVTAVEIGYDAEYFDEFVKTIEKTLKK